MIKKKSSEKAIDILKSLKGLGKEFVVLSEEQKKEILKMPEKKSVINRGVIEALSRKITIAFSHNELFRPPPCAIVLLSYKGKIVGEMTNSGQLYYNGKNEFDEYVLPPVPFPELEHGFAEVCSASPGYSADKFIRSLISVENKDATLLIGFNR